MEQNGLFMFTDIIQWLQMSWPFMSRVNMHNMQSGILYLPVPSVCLSVCGTLILCLKE